MANNEQIVNYICDGDDNDGLFCNFIGSLNH